MTAQNVPATTVPSLLFFLKRRASRITVIVNTKITIPNTPPTIPPTRETLSIGEVSELSVDEGVELSVDEGAELSVGETSASSKFNVGS